MSQVIGSPPGEGDPGDRGADPRRPLQPPARPPRQPPEPGPAALAPGPGGPTPSTGWSARLLITAKRDSYPPATPVAERYFEAAGGPRRRARRRAARVLSRRGGRPARGALAAGWASATDRPIVAMAPGAAHATKRWPAEHWAELVRRITPTGADVVVSAGRTTPSWRTGSPSSPGPAWRAWRASSVSRRPARCIRRAEVLVSGDTGVMHMATGVGTPVVALFGPTVAAVRLLPLRSDAGVVELDLPCRPCSAQAAPAARSGHHRCMRRCCPTWSSPRWPRRRLR